MAKDRLYFASLQECNEKCLFCIRRGEKARPIKHLDTNESKRRIAKVAKEGWKTLIFDGGEPTLRADLFDLLEFAQKKGFKNISILTNGIELADKNFLEKTIKAVQHPNQGVKLSFGISLHSHKKEISEYLVNTPDTFDKTIKGIANALKFGIPVSIYHIITTYNYKDLPAFVNFLHDKFPQIKNLTFSFIYPAGAALENKDIFAKISEVEPYLYKAMEAAKKYSLDFSISTCGTIPLCYLKGYEIYTVNQQKLDQPENVGISDSTPQKRSKLATKEFHKESKIKTERCTLCLLNKLCSGLWKVYAEKFGTEELQPVIDGSAHKTIKVDLNQIEKIKSELINFTDIFFVDFEINNQFNKEKFDKVINFIKWLKEYQLNYLIKKPLPCFLENFQSLYENLAIPQNCQECLDLFKVVQDRVYFCNGAKGKTLEEYNNRAELFADFQKSKENKKSGYYQECYFRKFKANFTNSISPYAYIGYQCNNNCIYCSEADEYMENLKPKNFNQIKEEIKEVRKKYDFINFMGREPTLRKDFLNILKFAQGLNFRQVGFTTNGRMLVYPNFAKLVLETGVNQIVISLNGATAKIHDRETEVFGSFNQTITGIKNVMRLKKPEVSVIANLPLNKLNYFELKPTIDLVEKLGIREINILFIAPLSRRSRSEKIVMEMNELGKYVFNTIKPYLNNSNLKFLLVEFLPCSLPKEAQSYFFPCLEKNPDKVRIPLCQNCSYKTKCDGVLKSYINLYGAKGFKL